MAHLPQLVTLSFRVSSWEGRASFASVFDVLRSGSHLLERFAEFFPDVIHAEGGGLIADLGADGSNLILIETVLGSADGALELIFKPSDRYLEFVAAIARDGNVTADFDAHGWPILSVVSAQPTVVDAGGVASLSGESANGKVA